MLHCSTALRSPQWGLESNDGDLLSSCSNDTVKEEAAKAGATIEEQQQIQHQHPKLVN